MVFWILLVFVFLVAAAGFCGTFDYDGFWPALGLAACLAAAGTFVGFLVLCIAGIWLTTSPHPKGDTEYGLAALQTSSTVSGHFYLGSGYIDGSRTLNYITDDNGAFRIESASASDSVVYQDASSPTVTIHHWESTNPWLIPWGFGAGDTYTFHIPEGSILSDYTIDNQ